LSIAHDKGAHHIRVINLSVYDQHINPNDLTQTFQALADHTIAQGAHLHIRCLDKNSSDPHFDFITAGKMPTPIRIDSVELG
jgi:Zn finger protein HypA/HybF involved in hydrogenase expression